MTQDKESRRASLQRLYGEAIAGGKQHRDELITEAMPLARSIARGFIYDEKRHDDCEAQAYLVLIEEVDSLLSVKEVIENIQSYLSIKIRWSLCNYSLNDELIGPCSATRRKAKKNAIRAFTLLSNDGVFVASDGEELRRDILEHCEDDLDRRIVELREAGSVDSEIGPLLGISGESVRLRRKSLESRYMKSEMALGA